ERDKQCPHEVRGRLARLVQARVLGFAGGGLLGCLRATEFGDHGGLTGHQFCAPFASAPCWRAASRRCFAPLSHCSQRAASNSPRSHSSRECSRVGAPCSSSATTRISSSRACSYESSATSGSAAMVSIISSPTAYSGPGDVARAAMLPCAR